jgi:hypothetical protein
MFTEDSVLRAQDSDLLGLVRPQRAAGPTARNLSRVPWALTQLRGPLGEGQEGRRGQQKALDLLPLWLLPATPRAVHMHRLPGLQEALARRSSECEGCSDQQVPCY